jgi:hypothetical protein
MIMPLPQPNFTFYLYTYNANGPVISYLSLPALISLATQPRPTLEVRLNPLKRPRG